MNSVQESKISMYLALIEHLIANAAIVNPLPNFLVFFTAFQGYVTQILAFGEQQQFDKTGFAENKGQLRSTLVMLAADTSRKLTAYAKFTNNQVLMNETKYTESDLNRMSDNTLRDAVQGVYDRAEVNLTNLGTYGVSPETQISLQNALTAYVASIPKPRLSIADNKLTTNQLANLFKQADGALDNIDTLVEILHVSRPNFYKGYKAVRRIVEKGKGSLAVKGFVTDAITGEPIKGAILTFVAVENEAKASSGKALEPIVKRSADRGGFYIKLLPAGIYQVTIRKNGYQEQIVTIAVNAGELTELNIQLVKS